MPASAEVHHLRTELVQAIELPYLGVRLRPGAPLLLWLHGAGEKGCPPERLADQAIVAAAARHAPELALALPVCPAGRSGWRAHELIALLDALDPGPVIVAGTSMGGRGAWELAYDHAERLAGLIAIAAVGLPMLAPRLGDLPCWIAHGRRDAVVPIGRGREMADALPDATWRELDAGHACTSNALRDPALWSWIARQSRSAAARS